MLHNTSDCKGIVGIPKSGDSDSRININMIVTLREENHYKNGRDQGVTI